jgi:hypothetical protein
MKISIIVPTRNRGEYLPYCLATCLSPDDKHIEVIVSDNNSSDQTRQVVSGIADSRLRYFNTGENLSMRQNFEFALSKATGDYLIFIGDDDGLLRNGLSTLRFLIEKHRSDVINWNLVRYIWPRSQPEPENGVLNFRSRDFYGPLHHTDPRDILSRFCDGKTVKYKDGANIYHGCVARHVIDTLRERTGEYFQAQSPDVYASIANLSAAKSFLWLKNPITIGGESEKSNGAANATRQHQTTTQTEIAASFRSLANADTVTPEIDLRVRAIVGHTYANLLRVNKLIYDGRLTINHQRWRGAILKDIENLPAEVCRSNNEILQEFFSEADPKYRPGAASKTVPVQSAPSSPSTVGNPKPKKKRRRKIASRHTQTVAAAAEWINGVTGSSHLPKMHPAAATVFHLWKIIEMDIKARRIA